jgi:hypothetical protein
MAGSRSSCGSARHLGHMVALRRRCPRATPLTIGRCEHVTALISGCSRPRIIGRIGQLACLPGLRSLFPGLDMGLAVLHVLTGRPTYFACRHNILQRLIVMPDLTIPPEFAWDCRETFARRSPRGVRAVSDPENVRVIPGKHESRRPHAALARTPLQRP